MANQRYNLVFDAKLEVGQIKSSIGEVQKILNGLNLPSNFSKNIQKNIDSLTKSIQDFEVSSSKTLTSKADFSSLEKNAKNIERLFDTLKLQFRDLSNLSGKDLDKLFPESITKNIQKATQAMQNYSSAVEKSSKKIQDANNKVIQQNQKVIAKTETLQKAQERLNQSVSNQKATGQKIIDKTDAKDIDEGIKKLDELIKKQEEYNERVQNNINKNGKKYNYADSTKQKAQAELDALKALKQEYEDYSRVVKTNETSLKAAQTQYNNTVRTLEELKNTLEQVKQAASGDNSAALEKLYTELAKIDGVDLTNVEHNLENAEKIIERLSVEAREKLVNAFNAAKKSSEGLGKEAGTLREKLQQLSQSYTELDARAREVNSLKTRIQYFFGLNNAIQLVRRTIRSAYQTISELDKAMTETAVVTDFTVSDMWAQLPEYTKRANELGVATLDAYKAATLYYQQGLKTNEVTALSNETLKMARIAGLDAADATDRMTNALRGFNMELTETNAQRVDDVYSQLAANTASNVDEISTAMTKVASLAHNANMEFENTAAFLAQIIETTRESAETAGTALKTVVARFSEIKKLYNLDELAGKDEEGQTIDVNKVAVALRTAGIDLNKYFLGEVGLDDIFIELASKWNTLTSVQQRYIATQAAGSRQQSRFIALMSDYARTQELTTLAYNSSGAAAKQFEKTQDSLQSKLARLKNAWNEFTMGITNSSFIKVAVGGLTTILKFVNQLTSAFGLLSGNVGSFVSGLLKLGVGFGALKLGGKAFNGLFNSIFLGGSGKLGSVITNAFKNITSHSVNAISEVTKGATEAIAGVAGEAAETIAGVAGEAAETAAGVGGEVVEGAVGVAGAGSVAATSGVSGAAGGTSAAGAAGAAGLGSALGIAAIIAVVVAVLAGIGITLYRASAKGQLAISKNYVESMEKASTSANNASKNNINNYEKYKEYNDNIKQAQSIEELTKAYQERNDYITSLIKDNKDYTNFLSSTTKNGKMILELDEESFEEYNNEIANNAKNVNGVYLLSQANELYKEEDVAYSRYKKSRKTREDLVEYTNTRNYLREKESILQQQAYQEFLSSDLPGELANGLSNVLAKTFTLEDYQQQVENYREANWWTGKGSKKKLREQYKEIYGVEADSNMGRGDLARAVAQGQVAEEQKNRAQSVEKLVSNNERYQPILNAIAGTGKITEINLSNLNEEDFISALGLDTDESQTAFEELASALGKEKEDLIKLIKATGNLEKQVQQTNKAKLFQKIFESGNKLDKAQIEYINSLTPKDTESYLNMLEAGQGLLSEEQYRDLGTTRYTGTQMDEITNFFNSIDLENPIAAFDKLQNAIDGTNDVLSDYAKQILEANKETFNLGNMVQSFIASADYEELTEELAKFIEKNGEITTENIDELAESSKALKKVLDLDGISAQGLAKALTALEKGEITFDSITESTLRALSAGEDFNTLINNIHKAIEEFDEGIDYGEGTDFIKSQAESLTELVKAYEFGNERTRKIYTQLFGEQGWQTLADKAKLSPATASEYGLGEIERIQNLAEYNSLKFMREAATKNLGVTNIDDYNFTWDLTRFKDTADLLDEVASKFRVSSDSARMLVEGFAAQSIDFAEDWNKLNYDTQLQEFVKSFKDTRAVTEQQLKLLAVSTGKTTDEIYNDLITAFSAAGKEIPIKVSWVDEDGVPLTGDSLIEKINNELSIESPTIRYKYHPQEGRVGKTGTGIDAEAFKRELEAYGLAEAQAIEYINSVAASSMQKLVKDITVPIYEITDDGAIHVGQKTVKVEANTWDELTEAENAALEAAKYDMVGQAIVSQDLSPLGANLYNTLVGSANSAKQQIETILNGITFKVNPEISDAGELPEGAKTTTYTGGTRKPRATGGLVNPSEEGIALTGEEGPEIVWNKKYGYAYITGARGAQFQDLQPGDRVFTAKETRRILANSKYRSKIFGSHAEGGYNKDLENDNTGTGSGETVKVEGWKNDFDRLFNLLEDINEEQRKQTQLDDDYKRLLADQNSTSWDLLQNRIDLLQSYAKEYQQQGARYLERDRDILEYIKENSDYSDYFDYNFEDQTVEIKWDLINALKETDKETYDKISEVVSHLQDLEKDRDEAEDAMREIAAKIKELENAWRDSYVTFYNRVRDALIQSYQDVIDNYSDLNETLNKTASDILKSLQEEINLERQIRDNTKTEEDISDKEARLAYLRRDTTGANDQEILQLEKELEEQRQNYQDTLVDQAIDRLADQNDKAAEQREHQIEIMQAQLDYSKANGEFNDEVKKLIEDGIDENGRPVQDSNLVNLLKNQEAWTEMSDEQKEIWAEDLTQATKETQAYLDRDTALPGIGQSFNDVLADTNDIIGKVDEQIDYIKSLDNNLTVEDIDNVLGKLERYLDDFKKDIIDNIPAYEPPANYPGGGGGTGGGTGGTGGSTPGIDNDYTPKWRVYDTTPDLQHIIHSLDSFDNKEDAEAFRQQAYAMTGKAYGLAFFKTGGLASFTGPAWLDGTKSKPEYVLNPEQTEAFLKLAEVLPELLQTSKTINSTQTQGDIYLDITMNVEKIADDYDVDQIADRVKEIIYDASSYRNVNVLNFIK